MNEDGSRPHTLSLMPTWRCTAACTHCGTESTPSERTSLNLDQMKRAIEQAASTGYKVVVFTGGEATLAGAILLSAIRHARQLGLHTRLVTNGYWALTSAAASRRAEALTDAGLEEINFSTGDEHARFVPLDRLLRGVRASVAATLPATIMVETRLQRKITAEVIRMHPDYIAIGKEFPNTTLPLRESPWMPLDPHTIEKYDSGVTANQSNVAVRTGCDSVLTTTTVQADGRIAACCGLGIRRVPELQTGHIDNTTLAQADERASDDFLKHWLRVEGPERILAWAADHDSSIAWEDMYAHRCQACLRLYTDPRVADVVRQYHHEKIPDVLAAEYLLFHHPDIEDC